MEYGSWTMGVISPFLLCLLLPYLPRLGHFRDSMDFYEYMSTKALPDGTISPSLERRYIKRYNLHLITQWTVLLAVGLPVIPALFT